MGYCKVQVNSNFYINSDKVSDVIQAIKNIPKNGFKLTNGSYAYVAEFQHLEDVIELFSAWRYDIVMSIVTGNIISIEFSGGKIGNCDVLFKAIAPFVREGSFIDWVGEDGAIWSDVFENGEHKQI
jgi:hypothetical protein